MRFLFGAQGGMASRPDHVVGKFNGHLMNSCLLFADEAFFAGSHAQADALKGLITEPKIVLEAKGKDIIEVDNHISMIIASNHVMIVQAQALAEAGLERALWALSTPESVDGIAWSGPAAAPYDGSAFLGVATESGAMLGGFRLTVSGEGDRQREVATTGLVPGDAGPLGRARQDITATLIRLRFPASLAGLAVRGDLAIGDGVTVDASADGSCGERAPRVRAGSTCD